ncbi:ABC multidrug transporter, partial [Phlyctema vagabunda]
ALARALYSRLPFLVCDDILSGLDPQTQDLIWDNIFGTHGLLRLHRITTVLATHSVHRLRETDHLVVLGDGGTIVEQGTFESLTTGNGYAKEVLTRAPENSSKISQFRDAKSPAREKEPEAQMVEQSENSNDLLRRTGDMQVYNYYLKSIGWYHGVVLFLLTFAGEFCLFFPQIWVKWWAEADSRNPGAQTGLYYTVYLLLGVIGLLLVGSAVRYNFVITGPDSGAYLHLKLLNAIMRAPLSFFVRTDTGVTVNRFSQDLSLVDMVLPGNSWLTFVGIIKSIGISTLILMGIKYMAAVIPLTVLVLYLLQLFYLRTSRQLRHLDLEAKSPLYTHLLEGIQGLTTIRAYNWTSSFQKTGLGLLDVSQRPFYLLYCIQRWLNFVLDILVALLAVFFVGITVSLKGQTTAGAVGLALLNILSLNSTLAFTIETWTELETSLGAIARLRAIESTTESEEIEQSEVIMPTAEWPQEGKIVFESMTVAYAKDSNPVLRDVNLTIKHGEKVAICGRTGRRKSKLNTFELSSGKSTLILALTHLLDPIHGTRVISGIDTKCIPRSFLRSKLNTIPQEPFFLSSQFTLGENLSLFCNPPPDESSLTSALDIVQLSHLKPLLSSGMASVSLSQGEKQLFCLARAIVKKDSSPFLILDEANAALDIEKDELMHEILRKEFASKTIVSVVHKLQDIVGFYDKVLVLDQDGVAEFDDPAVLLQNEGSVFRGMVREKI